MVKVLLFGVLAEKAGTNKLEIKGVKDLNELRRKVLDLYPEFHNFKYQTSVNQTLTAGNLKLSPGDEVALLPPFAGG